MNTLKEAARLNHTCYTHLFGQVARAGLTAALTRHPSPVTPRPSPLTPHPSPCNQGALVDGDQLVEVSENGELLSRSQSVPVLATEAYVRRLPDKLPVLRVAERHAGESPMLSKVDSIASSLSVGSRPNPAHQRRLHKRGGSLPRLATAHLPYTAEQQRVRMEWQQHRLGAGDATVGQQKQYLA